MYKVPAPLPAFLVLTRLYAVVDPYGARLHKTQHSHLPMDPLTNPHHAVYYNSSTTPDDVRTVYKTQREVMMLPSGAVPTYLTTSIRPPQVEGGPPFLLPTGFCDHTNRVPTPFSTDSPSDGSETSPYDPSTSALISLACPTSEIIQDYSHPSPPPPIPGSQNNTFQNYPHTSAHSQPRPQQRVMPTPPGVQGVGGGSVCAGPSTGPHRLAPAVMRRPSGVAQSMALIVSPGTGHSAPSCSQYQGLGLAPSGAKRRFSEVDPLGVQHTQVDFLTEHPHENQPFPGAYPSYTAISTAQYPAVVPADVAQGPSSYTRRGSVASVYSEGSLQLPVSPALQDDLESNATVLHSHASPGTSPHFTDHTLPQRGTSLAAPEAPRKKRRAVQRKRVAIPKDPKAAERLQNQRQLDDEHIEYLYKVFVPTSEGEVPKKDRLGLSTS